MNILIFPSIAEITLVSIIKDKPSFPEQSETLGRQSVVFMDLRQSIWEIIGFMIKREVDGEFGKFQDPSYG